MRSVPFFLSSNCCGAFVCVCVSHCHEWRFVQNLPSRKDKWHDNQKMYTHQARNEHIYNIWYWLFRHLLRWKGWSYNICTYFMKIPFKNHMTYTQGANHNWKCFSHFQSFSVLVWFSDWIDIEINRKWLKSTEHFHSHFSIHLIFFFGAAHKNKSNGLKKNGLSIFSLFERFCKVICPYALLFLSVSVYLSSDSSV